MRKNVLNKDMCVSRIKRSRREKRAAANVRLLKILESRGDALLIDLVHLDQVGQRAHVGLLIRQGIFFEC